jgi:hypothetical protein
MLRFDGCLVIPSVQLPAARVTVQVRALFKAHGLEFAAGSDVIFNDFQDQERDPEPAETQDEAFEKILSWPGLGGAIYYSGRRRAPLFFNAGAPGFVDSITLSFAADAGETQPHQALIRELHLLAGAARTICGYELLSPASWVPDEVERVRRGVFAGSYSVDLR